MKKLVVICCIAFSFAIASTGCNSPKEGDKHEHADGHEADHDEDHAHTYACPMQCEGDKTYEKPGSCPDCKMELEAIEEDPSDHDRDEDSGTDSTEQDDHEH